MQYPFKICALIITLIHYTFGIISTSSNVERFRNHLALVSSRLNSRFRTQKEKETNCCRFKSWIPFRFAYPTRRVHLIIRNYAETITANYIIRYLLSSRTRSFYYRKKYLRCTFRLFCISRAIRRSREPHILTRKTYECACAWPTLAKPRVKSVLRSSNTVINGFTKPTPRISFRSP